MIRKREEHMRGEQAGLVGRLELEKGIADLVDGFMAAELADSCLAAIGAGSEMERLERAAASLKHGRRIRVLTDVRHREIHAYLAALDVLVLPSVAQPPGRNGRVLVEVAFQGTFQVGSRCGWIPRLMEELDGIVVPQRDAQAVAPALREVADRKRESGWGEARRQHRQKAMRYSVGHVAAQLREYLAEVAGL